MIEKNLRRKFNEVFYAGCATGFIFGLIIGAVIATAAAIM